MKRIKPHQLVSVIFIIVFSIIAFDLRAEIVDRTLAVVNEEVITLSEVLEVGYSSYEGGKLVGLEGEKRERAIKEILDQLIESRLKVHKAKKMNLTVTDQNIDKAIENIMETNGYHSLAELTIALKKEGISLKLLRGQLKDKILIAKLIGREVHSKVKITSREIKEFYQKHLIEYENKEQIRVRHLLLPLSPKSTPAQKRKQKKKALNLLKRVKSGEDFGELAKEYSAGPTAKEDGGDLGFFYKGDLIPEFDRATIELQAGEVSEVFSTSFGYNLIQLVERKLPGPENNPEVSRNIEKKLRDKKVNELFQKYMEDLKKSAYIERYLPFLKKR